MRIDGATKANAEKAAALLGKKNLSEYVTQLIRENAEAVIREHSSMVLDDDVFDRFMAACDAAAAPNEKLRKAVARSKSQDFE